MNALITRNNNNYGLSILDEMFNGWNEIYKSPLVKQSRDRHAPTVRENEENYEIYLAAPGLEKKDFNIALENSELTVSNDVSDKKDHYAYATKYSKSYTVPADCDIENISASYKNVVGNKRAELRVLTAIEQKESRKTSTNDNNHLNYM